jgi:hypothetical protein
MVRKRIKPILLIVLLVALLAGYAQISKANAVDDLRIKIGYFGWSTDDYIEKAHFTWKDLEEMGTVESVYSYFGGTRVAIDSARGVLLTTILDEAGIDQSSIAQLDFYTADQTDGVFQSFTSKELLHTRRYYFPNLAGYMSYDEDENVVVRRTVWDGAKRVYPMLALEENWTWYSIGTSGTGANFTSVSTANRFRLNFGQSDPMESKTYASAKMVHTIYVMFSGSPQISADESNLEAKVGSDHKVKITAAAADDELEKKIQDNLQWSSSDTSVVSVDEDGTLHYNGVGTATVTAYYGNVSTQISITVTDGQENEGSGGSQTTPTETETPKKETEEKEEVKEKENQKKKSNQTGTGSQSGSGKSGSSGGSGSSTASVDSEAATTQEDTASTETESEDTAQSNVFVLSRGAGKHLKLALARQAASEDASMNTVQQAMDSDAEQLVVQEENDRVSVILGVVLLQILICGVGFGIVKYYLQA